MNASPGQAKSIFLSALEIASPAERQAYLDAHCGDDAALRREVEALLEQHADLGSFLEAGQNAATLPPAPPRHAPPP